MSTDRERWWPGRRLPGSTGRPPRAGAWRRAGPVTAGRGPTRRRSGPCVTGHQDCALKKPVTLPRGGGGSVLRGPSRPEPGWGTIPGHSGERTWEGASTRPGGSIGRPRRCPSPRDGSVPASAAHRPPGTEALCARVYPGDSRLSLEAASANAVHHGVPGRATGQRRVGPSQTLGSGRRRPTDRSPPAPRGRRGRAWTVRGYLAPPHAHVPGAAHNQLSHAVVGCRADGGADEPLRASPCRGHGP